MKILIQLWNSFDENINLDLL